VDRCRPDGYWLSDEPTLCNGVVGSDDAEEVGVHIATSTGVVQNCSEFLRVGGTYVWDSMLVDGLVP
jgi:hypothetical protein